MKKESMQHFSPDGNLPHLRGPFDTKEAFAASEKHPIVSAVFMLPQKHTSTTQIRESAVEKSAKQKTLRYTLKSYPMLHFGRGSAVAGSASRRPWW